MPALHHCSRLDLQPHLFAGIPGARQRLANAAEVEYLHLNQAIKLRAPNTALISLPLLEYAVGWVSGWSAPVPSILGLSTAPSHNHAIHARQDGTNLPAAQSSAIIGLLFVPPVCTAELYVFPRRYSPPQEHALHREIKEFESWMSTPTMPSRQSRSSASRTADYVLNRDCLLNLGCMFPYLGGVQSVIVLGNRQGICLYCFPASSIAVDETRCKGNHTIHSQH